MALLIQNNLLFLHIPKTGGNWVTAVLRSMGLIKQRIGHKHATFNQLPKSFVNTFLEKDNARVFCFIRHPLSWYESWFKYMTQPSRNWRAWGSCHEWHPCRPLNGLGDADFNRFMHNVLRQEPGFVTRLYDSYIQRPSTRPTLYVGKQENLRNDLIEIFETTGVEFDRDLILSYPAVGVSPQPMPPVQWGPGIRTQAESFEARGISEWGYQ